MMAMIPHDDQEFDESAPLPRQPEAGFAARHDCGIIYVHAILL